MLMDLRAADYLVLVAMIRSLQAADEYGEDSERLMLDFTLSSQFVGEAARKRAAVPRHR